jgi:LuxR family maltose regulon positive regulatory protein
LAVPDSTLIRSKLLPPSAAGLLHRPQVCQAIERGLECKLTVVSAPAGYGKTSALVDFVQHSPVPVCWYTADERDRDLGLFIQYLVGAIGERFPGFGEHTRAALASLPGDLSHDPTGVTGELANGMIELDTPFAVVVDNYEALDGAFGIRAFIRRLLEILPLNCHLMLGSRVLPDVPVTQLVAARQIAGLTACDLHFTPREIQDLLRMSQIEVSEARAEVIATSSEGWITGILLLADLLREEAETTLLDAERATAETYDYLAVEVLNRQPPDVQHFLCTSSVLREMSVQLCREVLQFTEPQALLAELERRNLFVTRLGRGDAAVYRYHNLFRDFLQQQFQQRDPARYAELHLQAAARFEQENDVEEAVYHYLAAEAYPEATVLMERAVLEWFTRGRVETLLRWAGALPAETKAQAPRLAVFQSRVLTDRYDYEGARQALAHAEAGFAARRDAACLAKVHNQRATLRLFEGRYEDAIVEAETALEMLGPGEVLERANAQRHVGRGCIGLGRLEEGIAKLQDALTLFRQVAGRYDVVNVLQDLTPALVIQGRLDEAGVYLNEALAIARRLGAPKLLAGVLNNLGVLHHLRGEYQESLALYEEGLAAARRGDDLQWQAYISVGMADLYRDVGAYKRAATLYTAGWQITSESEPALAFYTLTAQADMHRWQGDHARALGLLRDARRLAEKTGLEFEERGLLSVAEGITLAESGDFETGLRLLSDGAHFLEQRQAKRELARAHLLLAKARFLAGDGPQAVAELRQAMDLADEVGTYQFAIAEGGRADGLLKLGVTEGVVACRDVVEGVRQLEAFREQLQAVPAVEEGEASRLEIYAFGEERVVRDGRVVSSSEWQAATVKELFFYILLHGPQRRDAIGVIFWPDLPAKSVASNFHNALYRMRRALGAEVVTVEEGRYRLGDIVYWFDVEQFEELVGRARLLPPHDWQAEDLWRRALALYQGDFLPEVERTWCVLRRETLRGMYVEALVGIGLCHEARREFEGAIDWYRHALEADELREDVHRRIMRCYAETGRRPEALTQYRRLWKVLRRELGIEPSNETKDLYKRIAGKGQD